MAVALSDFVTVESPRRLHESISLVLCAEIPGQFAGFELSVLVKLRAATASISEQTAVHARNALHNLISREVKCRGEAVIKIAWVI